MHLKQTLKHGTPQRARLYIRRANRLRWVTKAKVLRQHGAGPWEGRPLRRARYVLADPEIDTFTYPVANLAEMSQLLAEVLEHPAAELQGYIEEALTDPDLGPLLSREIGPRAIYMKRRPPLPAHHLAAWALIRASKPKLVVETGILEGLGSRTMLCALQRNSKEGHPGRLMSFDVLPGSGKGLVPKRLRASWDPIYEPTPEALPRHLAGLEVDFFLHDSVQEYDHLVAEVDAMLPFMAPGGTLMTVAGWTGLLEQLAERLRGCSRTFREQPLDHFYSGRTLSWMRLPLDYEGASPGALPALLAER
ncbi:MAG TPA: class I SAM-dependent methyltransferase [Solirubrobacterales bacterium]|nr:class I SAM-dependent methyltransferase [Solirubrobacterales bacterium]